MKTIENLKNLKKLRFLALSVNKYLFFKKKTFKKKANNLQKVGDGLEGMLSLQEVYLSENFITHIEGVSSLVKLIKISIEKLKYKVNLTTLDYSYNKIEKIEKIETLQQLEEFWVN